MEEDTHLQLSAEIYYGYEDPSNNRRIEVYGLHGLGPEPNYMLVERDLSTGNLVKGEIFPDRGKAESEFLKRTLPNYGSSSNLYRGSSGNSISIETHSCGDEHTEKKIHYVVERVPLQEGREYVILTVCFDKFSAEKIYQDKLEKLNQKKHKEKLPVNSAYNPLRHW